MTIVTVGIDFAKNVFAVHGVDATGKATLIRPSVPRAKLAELIAALPPCLIGMEACSGAPIGAGAFAFLQPQQTRTERGDREMGPGFASKGAWSQSIGRRQKMPNRQLDAFFFTARDFEAKPHAHCPVAVRGLRFRPTAMVD